MRDNSSRSLQLPSRDYYLALQKMREKLSSVERRRENQNRAGIEGTISQAVRRGTLRQARYRGIKKTHLQEIATATGINIVRIVNFLNHERIAKTRISRFARLAN